MHERRSYFGNDFFVLSVNFTLPNPMKVKVNISESTVLITSPDTISTIHHFKFGMVLPVTNSQPAPNAQLSQVAAIVVSVR